MKRNHNLPDYPNPFGPDVSASEAGPRAPLSSRDHDVFCKLYLEYIEGLVAFLRMLLGSQDEAEETAQEVFLKIWESMDSLDVEKNIKSYLFTSARRIALDKLRHRKVMDKYNEHILFSQPEKNLAPDEYIITEENEHMLKAAVESMPPKQKEVFSMSIYDGMTYNELAEKLQISKRTVQTHLYNAVKYLKNIMDNN